MPPNFQSSNCSSKDDHTSLFSDIDESSDNDETPLFSNNAELQQLLETVKLPTPHPDADFPKKKPASLNPTFGKPEVLQPIGTQEVTLTTQMTHFSSLQPTPTSLFKHDFIVRYLCETCKIPCKSASKHRAHILNGHKPGDDSNAAPTFVFHNNAPIGMEHIEMNENGYYCYLCEVYSPNAHDTIRHVCSFLHWTIYKKSRAKSQTTPSLYIKEIDGYLEAYPFVDSVKKLAFSKESALVFGDSADCCSVAEVFDLAVIAALRGLFDSGNESIGPEYVKQFIDECGLKCHWYCEACNCRLQKTTEKSRMEHTKSRQHHIACEKKDQEMLNTYEMLCEDVPSLSLIG
uniref:C2H2-type domain-containing protein n=1 Tax=Panagrellus redivivus TaxID=6233 RepID=A0A7E4ZX79_PANRE